MSVKTTNVYTCDVKGCDTTSTNRLQGWKLIAHGDGAEHRTSDSHICPNHELPPLVRCHCGNANCPSEIPPDSLCECGHTSDYHARYTPFMSECRRCECRNYRGKS